MLVKIDKDDFIKHQNIAYLDQKHKKIVNGCTRTLPLLFNHGFSNMRRMFFSFKKLVKSMGFKCHSSLASMSINVFMWPQWCYINGFHIWDQFDMKFHLFTLMVFNAHQIGVPLTWIITS